MEYNDNKHGHKWTGPDEPNSAYGNGGDDTLKGGRSYDYLYGGDGADKLYGGGGDDQIDSERNVDGSRHDPSAVDHVSGGDGADELSIGYGDFADGGGDNGAAWGDKLIIEADGYASGITLDLSPLAHGHAAANGGGTISNVEVFGGIVGTAFDDTITIGDFGLPAENLSQGWTGQVDGGAGDDHIIGGKGYDYFLGGDGKDKLDGGAGADVLIGGEGKDSIRGGDGVDDIDGDAGNDTLKGDAGNDGIYGGDGRDTLYGGDGDDFLSGDGGTPTAGDVLNGDAGNDRIRFSFGDTVDGGAGTDSIQLDLSTLTTGQVLDFSKAGGQATLGGATITGIEGYDEIIGSAGADVINVSGLVRTSDYNSVTGGAGDDRVTGGGSGDQLSGGDGDDTLTGNQGKDLLYGGAGNDRLHGGTNDDYLDAGGGGRDKLYGDSGADELVHFQEGEMGAALLSGGSGDDRINAVWGDAIDGGSGSDTLSVILNYPSATPIVVDFAADAVSALGGAISGVERYGTLDLGSGDDVVSLGPLVAAGPNISALRGEDGDDRLTGGAGGDVIEGDSGADRIVGGAGDDTLDGGLDNDTLAGGDGNDTAVGGEGRDALAGGSGNDQLNGDEGDDHITGDKGNDWIRGGDGNDDLDGGKGTDTVWFDPYAPITVDLAATGRQKTGEGKDLLSGFENVAAGSGSGDTLKGTDGDNVFYVGRGPQPGGWIGDVVDGRGGSDTIDFSARTDEWLAYQPAIYFDLGAAAHGHGLLETSDPLTVRNVENIVGSANSDQLVGDTHANRIDGGDGNDTLIGGGGDDTLMGGASDDEIHAGSGKEHLLGGDGNDEIFVAKLSDLAGDVIDGGAGVDQLAISEVSAGTIDLSGVLHHASIEQINASGDTLALSAAQLGVLTYVQASALHLTTGGTVVVNGEMAVSAIVLSDHATTLDLSTNNTGELTITGGSANDHIIGSQGTTVIDGGGGDDVMEGAGTSADTFIVNSTNDVAVEKEGFVGRVITSADYTLDNSVADLTLAIAGLTGHGNAGSNQITGSDGSDVIWGMDGDDTLAGNMGDDTIHAGAGTDWVDGGAGNDTISADGTATLIGGDGNDTIAGGSGADTITGGNGNDVMSGGGGGDSFVFEHLSTTEQDEITDYSSGQGDVLNFQALEGVVFAAGVSQIDYLGQGNFSGHAGQARIDLRSGYGLFQFDLDGDRVSDLTIKIDGVDSHSTVNYLL